jgi:formylglycine-generating enzyme required for sulfatase activity
MPILFLFQFKFALETALMPNRWSAALIALSIVAFGGAAVADPEAQTMQSGQTFRDCSDCPEMVVVPAGSFIMGSSTDDTERDLKSVPYFEVMIARVLAADEHPAHLVTFARPVAIGKYLVTRGEFAAFIRETGYAMASGECVVYVGRHYRTPSGVGWENPGFTQTDRDPVVCVSWNDAHAFIAWLNGKLPGPKATSTDGSGPYRLPSEAEWEYAARAGTQTAYWWGDAIGSGNAVCESCGTTWDQKRTAPVGSFRANPLGLYDMAGNASEWAWDCWSGSYVEAPGDGTARLVGDCAQRVVRGGNWDSEPWDLRSAHRARFLTGELANDIGFRVARTLP